MCGIIGYTGQKNALPILTGSLEALEYRGYDSAGISFFGDKDIITVKAKGRIGDLCEKLTEAYPDIFSACGIGHTRWATHGEPSDTNSHPHFTSNLSLVHNGIIENYIQLKEQLTKNGAVFRSDTDTEVAAILMDKEYEKCKDPLTAMRNTLKLLKGSYAFGIIFKDYPGKIFAAKKDSPLIIALGQDDNYIASDIPAVLKYTDKIIHLDDGETALITKSGVEIYDGNGKMTVKKTERISWNCELATKLSFPHFMLKEIFEQPYVIYETASTIIKNYLLNFRSSGLSLQRLRKIKKIHIVACGTAMHSGLIGKYYIEKLAQIPVEVDIASEFRYKDPILCKDDLFIAISQSGETADTLAALRLAKQRGLYALSVVNVMGSAIAKESDDVLYTLAGPEIAVASTKAYIVQIITLYLFALKLAYAKGKATEEFVLSSARELTDTVPDGMKNVLSLSEDIRSVCKEFFKSENLFFIGRGIDFYLACEASLKLKEISYIHSEGYAAGELQHGTISLITEGTPVVAIITEKELLSKTLSNIKEVRARGAYVIMICDAALEIPTDCCDSIIKVPCNDNGLSCLYVACAFQLLAYHTADLRGCDIDKPRNLAKSVTVE